jgi:hypothetical protein
LIKTFWDWRDQQLPDGTVILISPSGQTYVTTPGSALLFPSLHAPTGDLPPVDPKYAESCGNRPAMMPLRTRTREQNRAARIAAERRHNQREKRRKRSEEGHFVRARPSPRDDPPPF